MLRVTRAAGLVCQHHLHIWTTQPMLNLRVVAVAVAEGVPFKIGVSVVGGERMNDVRTVIVNAAALVGFCEFTCGKQ